MRSATRRLTAMLAAAATVLALGGCDSDSDSGSGSHQQGQQSHRKLTPAAEPGKAPPLTTEPAGTVVHLPKGAPWGIAVDNAHDLVAVALRSPGRLAFVDIASHQVRTVKTPGAARMLDVARSSGHLLFPSETKNALYQIALPSGKVVSKVPVGKQPHEATEAGGTIYLADEVGGHLGVIRNGKVVRTLDRPVQPGGITTAAGKVAVVDVQSNTLFVYDIQSLKLVAALPAGKGPSHVQPLGHGLVAVCDVRGQQIITYDLSGKPRKLDQRPVPGLSFGIATDPDKNLVYTSLANTNLVARLQVTPDGSLGKPVTLPTVRQPDSLAVDHETGTVYVAGNADSTVDVIPAKAFAKSG
jgi:DNA-binding beta-propeller fold protein YncE